MSDRKLSLVMRDVEMTKMLVKEVCSHSGVAELQLNEPTEGNFNRFHFQV